MRIIFESEELAHAIRKLKEEVTEEVQKAHIEDPFLDPTTDVIEQVVARLIEFFLLGKTETLRTLVPPIAYELQSKSDRAQAPSDPLKGVRDFFTKEIPY